MGSRSVGALCTLPSARVSAMSSSLSSSSSSAAPSTSTSASASASLPPLKLLLLGDSGVGKTSLMTCFADSGAFSANMISTAGVDCRVKAMEVEGRRVTVQVWDTAGQERFKTITRQYYRGAMGIMLVFDCTSVQSFEHVGYWLDSIAQYAHSEVAKVLVGNKCDMQGSRVVSHASAVAMAAAQSIPYIECSAKSNLHVEDAFHTLAGLVLPHLHLFVGAGRAAAGGGGGGDGGGVGRAAPGVIDLAERRRRRQKSTCHSCSSK